ncbi:unnamed protein product [Adineta steineri]|uniref:RING-type domain-containing protein n=2 Tax=Adineta steineri TaxID=433720 RepID=A0A818Q568_9BILA|nr:unnamed protein product [Adineta steineri]
MERLTTCPICLDKFRIPKVLPCMHTFCLTPCLTNLVDPRARSFRCPECRREHQIPPGGVQSFPSNLTMIGFLELPPPTAITDIPDRCFICKEQKSTLIKCNDCSKFLCTNCREPHLREAINNINSSVSQLRHTLPKLNDTLASYTKRVNGVTANHNQIRREITQTIASLIEELKHRETALLTETEVYMQSQLRTFRIQQETAEVELASVASFCDSVTASISNGQLMNDTDIANIRSQTNLYSQQVGALQTQMPNDMQKLRLAFDNQASISSSIQNFGQFVDLSTEQHHQQQQQPRFSSAPYPSPSTHYTGTSRNSINAQEQSRQSQYSRPAQNSFNGNMNNSWADHSLTIPARNNASPFGTSRNSQTLPRSNPFSNNNSRSAQRASLPAPEPLPRRNYVTSTNAARSLEGDDRPIFGGRGSGGGGGGGGGGGAAAIANRGRARYGALVPIQEQVPLTTSLERRGTFILDEPSLPNLPQSGAQRPRDTVVIEELYNVRRRNRARTPVAFTVNLNEARSSTS